MNHDRISIPAISVNTLTPLLELSDYVNSRLVIIEEAQFFPDLIPFVRTVVDRDMKHCVVVGLDGDAERRPFGSVLELVPLCDRVTKLTAMCKRCRDGTPALFTFASGLASAAANVEGVPCIGSDDLYIPLCRRHYLTARNPRLLLPSQETDLIGRI
ncbi:MAG: hypothetical protein EB023_15245 [Flavobacteriia bacterium]|nr:hypothetical protein [Flavobacteriia bacterium]